MGDKTLGGTRYGQTSVKSNNSDSQTQILTVSGQCGELALASELEVSGALSCGERRGLVHRGCGRGHNLCAVDQGPSVVAEHGEFRHRGFEGRGHELLFVDEALPGTGGALVACEGEVGLETHLAGVGAAGEGQGRCDFAHVVACSGETGAFEQDLEEDLGVEGERCLK